MTKKIMMVAVLLGALTLGACVDNKESASVEAVRNAKAAQLNSLAAMNNAEAEAKKIISEAEAALTNAEAAFRKAQAEAESIKTEKAKAELEGELAVIKIEAEANIANAKTKLEKAKAKLIKALDNVSIATKERINTLLGIADAYLNGGSFTNPATGAITAVTGLNKIRKDLVEAKNALIGLKYGLISAEAEREKTVIDEKLNKATAEALIAEYEKYSNDDAATAAKTADEAEAKAAGLLKIKNAKSAASTVASDAYDVASNNADATLYYTTLEEYRAAYYTTETAAKLENISFTYDNGVAASETKAQIGKRVAKIDMFQGDINTASRALAIAKASLSEAQKALSDKKATQGYKDQVKTVADAQTAFNAATTAADKTNAKATLENAEQALKNLTINEEDLVATSTASVTDAEKDLADANEALAAVSGDNATAYEAAVAKVVELRDANADAQIALKKATKNHRVQDELAQGLRGVVQNYTNYTKLILDQKKNIAEADAAIEDATTVITKEQAIAKKESKIAKLEVDLKAGEAAYSGYMAQIEVLIQGE